MGITISSESYSCDLGYGGFRNFRILVANNAGKKIGEHYSSLEESMRLPGYERDAFFEKYNKKTEELIESHIITSGLANFLFQSDCEGEIDEGQAKEVYELVENEEDEKSVGYSGRNDCANMKDMKFIFGENTVVEWG